MSQRVALVTPSQSRLNDGPDMVPVRSTRCVPDTNLTTYPTIPSVSQGLRVCNLGSPVPRLKILLYTAHSVNLHEAEKNAVLTYWPHCDGKRMRRVFARPDTNIDSA